VDIERFEALPGEATIIQVRWWLRSAIVQSARQGSSIARAPVNGGRGDYESPVAAEAAAQAQIGSGLAGAIEEEFRH
jgi:hypothetical protein